MTYDFQKNVMNRVAEIKQCFVLTIPTTLFSGSNLAGRTQDLQSCFKFLSSINNKRDYQKRSPGKQNLLLLFFLQSTHMNVFFWQQPAWLFLLYSRRTNHLCSADHCSLVPRLPE